MTIEKRSTEWIAAAKVLLNAHVAAHENFKNLMSKYADLYFEGNLPTHLVERIDQLAREEDQTRKDYNEFVYGQDYPLNK
jgi:hypothetical protein